MSTEIRRVALMVLAGFLSLTLGLFWWQVLRADQLNVREGNPRLVEVASRADRGSIFAADGTLLAHSEQQPDGRFRRVYALPSLAHTLGFVSTRYGVTGLEESLNDELSGQAEQSALDKIWSDVSRSRPPGNDVVLTIDPAVQQAAADALGDRAGSVVALDPRTGAVLAIVSRPGFDPNEIEKVGEDLLRSEQRPLLNRALQGQYTPGSTFKTVTAVAAIDSRTYPPDARFRCTSGYLVSGFVIACRNLPQGVTEYDFTHAYAWSINATFAEIAVKMGAPLLVDYSRRFGFEAPIPFDLPVAPSRLLQAGRSFDDVLLANTGFGQGQISVTPLQMALVAAAVANNGVLMQPYLVEQVRDPRGAVIKQTSPRELRRVMATDTATTLQRFMQTAVREGYGGPVAIPGVEVGGKTGTAETGRGTSHAWFTSIAPVGNAQVVVSVIVEDGGQGSVVAAPIAQAVMRAALSR